MQKVNKRDYTKLKCSQKQEANNDVKKQATEWEEKYFQPISDLGVNIQNI